MQKKNTFLIDTNVFISSFKSDTAKSKEVFIELIQNDKYNLISNEILIEEYKKYSKMLGPKSEEFFAILKDNSSIVKPEEFHIKKCKHYFNENSYSDVIHAATALKNNPVIITNDKDFNGIGKSNLIDVWTISKAIENIL